MSIKPVTADRIAGSGVPSSIIVLLLLLLLTLPAVVQAQFNYTTTNSTITITGYTGSGGVVTIPETINGLPVVSIGSSAFHHSTNLISITLPEGVTRIESSAFAYCDSLTNVALPSSMISIGDLAFYCCWGLTGATIPEAVISIGRLAFAGCDLTSVVIPSRVTSIGEAAFYCRNLQRIMVDAGNTCFCSVNDVLFDKNQTTLLQCPAGKPGSYTIPRSVTSIGYGAFQSCTSLSSVTIPNSVTNIGAEAFYSCTSLTSVTIPDSVISIGELAFVGCTSLTSVTIGTSVTSIGNNAFQNCSRLIGITVEAHNTAYSSVDGVLFNKSQSELIWCPETKDGSYAIPDSVTSIGNSAFEDCSRLTNLTIPNSITRIGYGAFSGCTSLTSITIPDSVTSIGYGAFSGCTSLTNVIIPEPKPQPAAHPLVEEMLRDIRPADLYSLMRQITGEEPVVVGNDVVVFTNRLTGSVPFRKATQFAFEQLQALGLQVQYQDWEGDWQSEPTYSDRNIVGTQPGVSRPDEIVVICAHFDAISDTNRAPGADDNGSGSAAVLTAASICSQYRFERTIHYVLFTGEEQHGLGSQEYVSQAVAGGSNIVAVLAPDMIGYASSALEPPTCNLTIEGPPHLGLPGAIGSEIEAMFALGFEIEAMFTNVVAMYGVTNTLSCSLEYPDPLWGIPSDAKFFFESGYSTLFLQHAHENPRYHTGADTLDALNFSYFTAMVQAIVGTGAHLAYPIGAHPPEQPVLGPVVLLSTGAVQVTLTGVAGRTYSIQASSDLTNWLTITNVDLTDPPGQFVDPAAAGFSQRFYRAIVP